MVFTEKLHTPMNIIFTTCSTIFALYTIHWATIQYYATVCATPGLSGFFDSFLRSGSTICIAANYIQFYSVQTYYNVWIATGLGILKCIHTFLNKNHEKPVQKSVRHSS